MKPQDYVAVTFCRLPAHPASKRATRHRIGTTTAVWDASRPYSDVAVWPAGQRRSRREAAQTAPGFVRHVRRQRSGGGRLDVLL